ncbi:lupeol synthase [Quercus suber]|uniref:Terpene cyclase/mutase family member n=1 Tax=Quercus suber TaxID=58331 RepID=A0AAW0KR97_QUESU
MWKLKIAEGGPELVSLNNFIGRQHWEFDPDAGTPEERAEVERMREEFKKNRFHKKQSADLLMRMQLRKENSCGPIPPPVQVKETEVITEEAVITTLKRALSFFSSIQAHDGHWPVESAGPLFFLPPMVMTLYITGGLNAMLSLAHQKEMIRYLYNHQNEDGGWGFHIEGHSTMFGTALCYIALRLLGEGPEDGEDMAMARGRKWILDHGSICMYLIVTTFIIRNTGKMLCYCRLVYMPMSYLYGKRFVSQITGLIQSLRQELYNEPYHQINWNQARSTVAKEDLYYPHPLMQDMLWDFLHHVAEPILTRWPFSKLREKALKAAIGHVRYEDENSRYLCIGGVNKILCLLARWVEDPNSEAFKLHLARIPDNYWVAEDGLKLQSFGSQMWDAVFAIQAILSCNLNEEYGSTLRKSHEFVKASQVRENPSGDFKAMYRHISKGAWTFSMQDHGWQVSDCTAEGLKVALLFSQMSQDLVGEKMETNRFYDAVNVILSLQSNNGGFPAWEPQRAYRWLEKFNPTEFFEDTLIEREYVECTSSAVQALALFRKFYPKHRRIEIDSSISNAIQYIEDVQEPDGSWYGHWGICYTYGTWFAVGGLVACGRNYGNCPALRKTCEFLLSKQLPNGGWGESYLSSQNKVWTNIEGNRANLVQTAWALLSLIDAGQAEIDATPIHRGIRVLINAQMEDGDFPQQEITGVFMRNCTLNYSSYRNIFPIWVLGEYRKKVLFAQNLNA